MPSSVPLLLPASSWYRQNFRSPRIAPQVCEVGVDVGGYVAMTAWGGRYPYEPPRYVEWIRSIDAPVTWAATMDYPCEKSVAGSSERVRQRQYQTTLRAWQFWGNYQDAPWAWVPTVQGWDLPDYVRHANELRPLLEEMQAYYVNNAHWRVGIGSLCNRVNAKDIRRIVGALAIELPGIPFHLWGAKRRSVSGRSALPDQVVSVDSAAWNGQFGNGLNTWKASGLRKRAYEYTVTLPRYVANFYGDQDNQQMRMF
jgi:hypothetical protein